MKIQHREKLTHLQKSHSEAIHSKNARIRKFMEELSGMQQMFSELLLVTTLKRDIQDCNNIIELLQFTHEETVQEYEEQLNEAVEEIHVSTCCHNLNALDISLYMFHLCLCSLRN